MWDQEKAHKAKFEELIPQYRVRPTVLVPLWNVAGFALGAGNYMLYLFIIYFKVKNVISNLSFNFSIYYI